MAYEDIRNKFLPLMQRTQGYGSLGSQDPRFSNAFNIAQQGAQQRAGLDKQLGRDLGTMRTGAALQIASPAIGIVNPVAGGAAFGAGNQMMGLKSGGQIAGGAAIGGASAGMLNKAISGLQASPMAQNMRASLSQSMPNKITSTPLSNSIEQRMTANSFNGKPMTTNMTNISGASNPPSSIQPPTPQGQVTNNFANQQAGNTVVRSYPQNEFSNQSLDQLINTSGGRMPATNTPPVQSQMPINGVSPQLNNVTNNFANTSPMNAVIQQPTGNLPSSYTSANDAVQGFMNDLNAGLTNQFGANSSPIGSSGSLGSLMQAEGGGAGAMGGAMNASMPEGMGQFGMNVLNGW